METVRVRASKSYDILIGSGILGRIGAHVREICGGLTAAVITDDIVERLYFQTVESSLLDAGYKVVKFVIQNGESSKNAANYLSILDFLAENGFTRKDVVVALGGGVVGDLAGFAAATYMRGTRFVQIPTTLLAAVDSSVGGKTAIDLESGKNLVGAFFQPDFVLCDYKTLYTLDEEVFRAGCAEIIKYGVIWDKELFELLKQPMDDRIEEIISRCVAIKRDVVNEDECDNGIRQILNFGHTAGHAIESLSRFKTPHGFAVAEGMALIACASAKMGLCTVECCDEIIKMLKRYELPTETTFGAEEIYNAALSDKKSSGDKITLIIPREIGKCELRETKLSELKEIIALGLERGA